MGALRQVSATGDVITGVRRLYGVVLTPAAALSTLEVRDGSGGPVLLTLQAAAGGSSVVSGLGEGVQFATAIHATLSGAGALAAFHYS